METNGNSLLDKVSGLNFRGGEISKSKYSAYIDKKLSSDKSYTPGTAYLNECDWDCVDCGDCDCDDCAI